MHKASTQQLKAPNVDPMRFLLLIMVFANASEQRASIVYELAHFVLLNFALHPCRPECQTWGDARSPKAQRVCSPVCTKPYSTQETLPGGLSPTDRKQYAQEEGHAKAFQIFTAPPARRVLSPRGRRQPIERAAAGSCVARRARSSPACLLSKSTVVASPCALQSPAKPEHVKTRPPPRASRNDCRLMESLRLVFSLCNKTTSKSVIYWYKKFILLAFLFKLPKSNVKQQLCCQYK